MKRLILKGTIKEIVRQLEDDMHLYKGYTIEQYVTLRNREERLKKAFSEGTCRK